MSKGTQSRLDAILATGASSGIGREIVEHLGTRGYTVLAPARKQEELSSLGKLANAVPLKLDVTIPEEIQSGIDRYGRRAGVSTAS